MKYALELAVLYNYNFDSILHIGCGDGTFTELLKKENNVVVGWDSATNVSDSSYHNINVIEQIKNGFTPVELIVLNDVFLLIEEWNYILKSISDKTKYLFISTDSLQSLPEIKKNYNIIRLVNVEKPEKKVILLARSKNEPFF